jgi:hypothetical protein
MWLAAQHTPKQTLARPRCHERRTETDYAVTVTNAETETDYAVTSIKPGNKKYL